MPHTKSAKKSLRKTDVRRIHNRTVLRVIKTHIKRFDTATVEGSAEAAQVEYNLAATKLDKAASRGIIHKNLAARKKSQLARKLFAKKKTAKPEAPKV